MFLFSSRYLRLQVVGTTFTFFKGVLNRQFIDYFFFKNRNNQNIFKNGIVYLCAYRLLIVLCKVTSYGIIYKNCYLST